MKTLAIFNQKGGTGKSTLATAFCSGLEKLGYKVLLLDLDAQCDSTDVMRCSTDDVTIYDVLRREVPPQNAVINISDKLDMIAGSDKLDNANIWTGTGYERADHRAILRDVMKPMQNQYDFCVIDCPPGINEMSINALTMADRVIIPALAERFSTRSFDRIMKTVEDVQKSLNPDLKIGGIIVNMFNNQSAVYKYSVQLIQDKAKAIGTRAYTVRKSVAIQTAQAERDYNLYKRKKSAASDDIWDAMTQIIRN